MIEPGDHVRHRLTGCYGLAETLPRGDEDLVTVRWGIYDKQAVTTDEPAALLERVDVRPVP